jgi:hypothetical protein
MLMLYARDVGKRLAFKQKCLPYVPEKRWDLGALG